MPNIEKFLFDAGFSQDDVTNYFEYKGQVVLSMQKGNEKPVYFLVTESEIKTAPKDLEEELYKAEFEKCYNENELDDEAFFNAP